jgi:hypothetical protein
MASGTLCEETNAPKTCSPHRGTKARIGKQEKSEKVISRPSRAHSLVS